MDILFVATELQPMVKVGGLADVVFALSKALRLLGHKVTLMLPHYPAIEAGGVMLARRLTPIELPASDGVKAESVTVFDARLSSGVDLVLVDQPGLYDRPGVYGDRTTGGEDYPDNGRRFGLLCRAALETIKRRAAEGNPFDVVHVHDWPTALLAYLLKLERQATPTLTTRSVLTLHNLGHQGSLRESDLGWFGLSKAHYAVDKLEFYGGVSALKGGIMAADAVTTVSETYAADIQREGHGDRLDGVLRGRGDRVIGILNAVDYAVWNPATDASIVSRYDADDPSNKRRSKATLLAELGLELSIERPLVAFVGRIAEQKGADVLAAALPKLLNLDAAFVVAGSGNPTLERSLEKATAAARDQARYLGQVAEPVTHKLIAGADIVVIPSRYEPCGLVQMYAQRYGSIPVATRTGGLIDSIVDCDAHLETGTGFLFDGPTPENLVGAVERAVVATRSRAFGSLVKRVMRLDRGWDRPARRYAQIYAATSAAPTN